MKISDKSNNRVSLVLEVNHFTLNVKFKTNTIETILI